MRVYVCWCVCVIIIGIYAYSIVYYINCCVVVVAAAVHCAELGDLRLKHIIES